MPYYSLLQSTLLVITDGLHTPYGGSYRVAVSQAPTPPLVQDVQPSTLVVCAVRSTGDLKRDQTLQPTDDLRLSGRTACGTDENLGD